MHSFKAVSWANKPVRPSFWFFRASFLCGAWFFFSTLGALLDSGGTTKIPRCGVSWPLVPTPPTPCIVLRSFASECCMGHVRRVSVVSSWVFSRTQVRQRALPRQSRVRLVVRSPESVMGTAPVSGSALRTTRRTLRHEVGLDGGGGLFQCACAHDRRTGGQRHHPAILRASTHFLAKQLPRSS